MGWLANDHAQKVQSAFTDDIQLGQTELDAGKTALTKANSDHSVAELNTARADFKAAHDHFAAASARIRSDWTITAAAGVYYVGPRVKAADAISQMGLALSSAALDGVDVNAMFIGPSAGGASGIVAIIRSAQPTVVKIRDLLASAGTAADSVDLTVLSANQAALLNKAKDTISKGLVTLNDMIQLIPVAMDILGGNGKRNYLVEQVDPAELRAGGGFIGTYSVLGADQGKLTILKTGSIDSVDYPRAIDGQPGYVAPPPPMLEFIGGKSWVLGDSNFFPDFAANAKAGEMFAQTEIGIKPDGVISIDPYTIADLLDVTGPIPVPEFGVTVQSKGFVSDLFQREEYVTRQLNRKDFIGLVATRLFEKIASLPSDRWPALLTAMNNAAATRHLQAYFNNAAAEKQMSAYGWSGVINPLAMPNLFYEVESNFGATKANYFLQRTYYMTFTRTAAGIHVDAHVFLKDPTPPGYNGGRVYRCYIRFYVPAAATNLTLKGPGPNNDPDNSVPTGYRMVDGWFQIDISPTLGYGIFDVRFGYDLPWAPDSSGKQMIYWQKQPGTLNDAVHVTWTVDGKSYAASGDLSADRVLSFSSTGLQLESGQPATAHLPSLAL